MRYVFFTLLAVNLVFLAYILARPAELDEPPRVPTYPAGVEPILLPSENREDAAMARVVENPLVQKQVDQTGCPAIGPFETLFKGQAAVEQLSALEIPADLRAIDQPLGESDYRVMIPPSASLEEAFRKLRELKSRDIESYVITQGADSLGISLGVFSTSGAALNAQAQHERQGYDTSIVEIPRLVREFWIFTSDPDSVQGSLWENLAAENAALRRQLMSCPPPG
ncbi:MAG: hypothetical protein ACFHX7_13210 [Pseudomonadota bacterium]